MQKNTAIKYWIKEATKKQKKNKKSTIASNYSNYYYFIIHYSNLFIIQINNEQIQVVDHAKILGLTISENLQWTYHISEVVKKANKRLYCLIQLKRASVPIPDIVNFYCTCIRPTLEYGAEVYHHSLPKYLGNELERVQRRSLAIIFPGKECNQTLQLSGLKSSYDRRQDLCKRLFQSVAKDVSHKLHKFLPLKNEPMYNLRHKRAYNLPLIHTKRFQNTFIPSMSKS